MVQSILFYSGMLFWIMIVTGIIFYYMIKNDKDEYFESESDYYRGTDKVEDEYHNKAVRNIYNKLEEKNIPVYKETVDYDLIINN